MKKNKSLWFLIVWFLWAVGKDCEMLYGHQTTSDYFVYSGLNIVPLFFILAVAVLILNLSALVLLIRRRLIGLKIAFGALVMGAIYNIITMGLGLTNIEGMKQAYIVSRETRGLPVKEESLSVMFTPSAFVVSLLVSFAFYGLIAYFIHKNRQHFEGGM